MRIRFRWHIGADRDAASGCPATNRHFEAAFAIVDVRTGRHHYRALDRGYPRTPWFHAAFCDWQSRSGRCAWMGEVQRKL